MSPPLGMLPYEDTKVCKLKNRNWYHKLTSALLDIGYIQSKADYTLFLKNNKSTYTCLLRYVDDLIIEGNDDGKIVSIKSHLHAKFHIKDVGKLKYFLGIEASQFYQGIIISQRKYTLDIFHKFGQLGTSLSPISLIHNLDHTMSDSNLVLADIFI